MVPGMSTKNRQTKQVRMVPRQSFSYKIKGLGLSEGMVIFDVLRLTLIQNRYNMLLGNDE